MGDWQVGRFRGPQEGVDPSDIANALQELYYAGQAAYRSHTFYRDHGPGISYRNRKIPKNMTNYTSYVRPSGYEGDWYAGPKPRLLTCKRVTGKNRPIRVQSVMKQLMNEQQILFQTLTNTIVAGNSQSWRVSGVNPLNSRYIAGGASSWPRTIDFPVWVYRLSAACGNQINSISGVVQNALPVVQYRLRGGQDLDGGEWVYQWIPTNPTNNSDPTYTTRNCMNIIEKEVPFNADKIYHDVTDIRILLTAPTVSTVNVNVDIVQFTEEEYAPPDSYLQNIASNASTDIDHGFAGPSDDSLLNEFYSTWLFNRQSHPCVKVHKPRGLQGPPPFRILRRHKMSLGNRDTATGETGGQQYMHVDILKEKRWHNTYIPPLLTTSDGPDVDPNGTVDQAVQDRTRSVGVFPSPTQQKWLMVSAFGSPTLVGGTLPGAVAFAPATEASFDISIRSKFKCINSITQYPVAPALLSVPEELEE